MKTIFQIVISIFILSIFIFIAFGSEDDETVSKTEGIETGQALKEENLTDSQKDSLNSIKIKKIEKGKKELSSFKKNKDDFENITFYKDPRTPYYTNVNFIYPYIGEKENQYWLRFVLQYTSDDWLFINQAVLMIDGEKFIISGNWERDNNTDIWEWLDIAVNESELIMLEKLGNSKVAKVRYEGNQYHKDRTITTKEKNIIKKTLQIYENLNQTLY